MMSLLLFASALLLLAATSSSAAAFSASSHHSFGRAIESLNPSTFSTIGHYSHLHHQQRRWRCAISNLFVIPGVSSLTSEITMTSLQHTHHTNNILSNISPPQIMTASASATLTYLALLLTFDRPRGRLSIPTNNNSLVIQKSRVPNAGLGLFVSKSYPEGTVLGTYPGVLRPAEAFYSTKCQRHPQALGYSWRFTDNKYVLDPTDEFGNIQTYCFGGSDEVPLSNLAFKTVLSFLKISTELTRINEPPIGVGGTNVSASENLERREVVFSLCRDVQAFEELFLDYGLDYDRSRYNMLSTYKE